MRPATPERPTSAASVRYAGMRQRLRCSNNTRVYPAEYEEHISTNNVTTAFTTAPTILALEVESLVDDINDKSRAVLKIPNDNPEQQPTVKSMNNGPIEVRICCVFLRVGEINTLNERYHGEFLLEASWEDRSVKGLQSQAFDPTVNWTPELELINGIGELHDNVTYTVRYERQGLATITEHHRFKGVLWERMELHYFPIDIQQLSLSVTTSRSNRDLIFVKNTKRPSGVNRRVFTDEQEWYLFGHVDITVGEQIDEYLDNGRNRSIITCSCYVARKYGYFIWNAYFLIFLITSASFTTFPIPLSNVHGRAQIACTLLLTSITFRWLCNQSLPTISYLTAVDIYAIGSIFSLCLLNIYHGVIGYINYYKSGSAFGSSSNVSSIIIADRWALALFTILFFGYQIGTVLWMYFGPWRKRRMMLEKDKNTSFQTLSRFEGTDGTFANVLGRKRAPSISGTLAIVSNWDL